MGKYAQLVIGTAGAGKSTYCAHMTEYLQSMRRTVHIMNFDPAADELQYEPSIDVRELLTVDQIMTTYPDLGPNGALVFGMERVVRDFDWLDEQLGDFSDDYLLIDCPGQIELFTHLDVMATFVNTLNQMGYRTCAVYLSESTFMADSGALVYSSLAALSAMLALGLPHINLLSKVDLLTPKDKDNLSGIYPDPFELVAQLNLDLPMFSEVNDAIAQVVSDYSLVHYHPLDYSDDDTLLAVVGQLDHVLQYYEDSEVKVVDDFDGGADE